MTGAGKSGEGDKLRQAEQMVLSSWGLVVVALAIVLLCGAGASSHHGAARAAVIRSLALTHVPRGPAHHRSPRGAQPETQGGPPPGYSPGLWVGGRPEGAR